MAREHLCGKKRGGDAALHVRHAASVKFAIAQSSPERRYGPAELLAERERVEMAVEDETLAGTSAVDHRHQVDDAGCRLEPLDAHAVDLCQKRGGDIGGLRHVAGRIGGGRCDETLRHRNQRIAAGGDLVGDVVTRVQGCLSVAQGDAPRCGSPSTAASR